MVDINRYLETQLALAKQRCEIENNNTSKSISIRSKTAAVLISNKQDKIKNKANLPKLILKNDPPLLKSRTSNIKSDDDSDYEPSCEEDDFKVVQNTSVSLPRSRQNVKKIFDDGDQVLYNKRVKNWRKSLTAAISGNFGENHISSADIKYVLDGHKNPNEQHELQNGLCVPEYLWKQLYKYQRIGVKWLWELHQVQSGGLLGDEMGLGKTVQIIAFLAGLSTTDSGIWGGLGPSIIVAPATVIYQWVSHFHYWFPSLKVAVLHNSGTYRGTHHKLLRDIYAAHGILLVTYAGVVKYHKDLLSQKWHYIILDEGHKIRNPETQVSKLIKKFQTPHKLLITGSPMQNSLQELWSLFDFMRPGLLGTQTAFMEHFAQPITQGGYANATEIQEVTALEIAKALKNMITPYMLRRTKAEVQDHIKLPVKNEQVLFCALSKEQRDLYMGYLMSGTVRSILDRESRFGDPLRARILVALSTLRKICNHPDLYLYEAHEESEEIDEDKFGCYKRSGKMTVVHSLLKIWQKQGHRALLFSQSRAMICILEQYFQQQGFKYLRMDGTVSVGLRQNLIKTFNENEEYLVFLATTRVGGLGVNLTGADRVIIYDPDWNPATDSQAKERAWRIGQLKNVTVYRLISAGTIEEKIYQRQVFKHLLSNKVLIDPNQKNVLTTSTLQGLFTLEELNGDGDTETSSLFKHTKVNLSKKDRYKSNHEKNESTSYSRKIKLEAMRKKAKEISRNIGNNVSCKSCGSDDPRETYKKKRELFLNPPNLEIPKINLLNDKETNIPFENVLSEIDIVNMHSKEDYEKKLINSVINSKKDEEVSNNKNTTAIIDEEMINNLINSKEIEDGELSNDEDDNKIAIVDEEMINNLINSKEIEDGELSNDEDDNKIAIVDEEIVNNVINSKEDGDLSNGKKNIKNVIIDEVINSINNDIQRETVSYNKTSNVVKNRSKSNSKKPYKRKKSPEHFINNLVAVKKLKKTKLNDKSEKKVNDDDYVLSKLFAKATVKNALQHDIVVGLADKEKKYRMKEEASKRATDAVRAVKFSSK